MLGCIDSQAISQEADLIEDLFGKDLRQQAEAASEGSLFLDLIFADF